MKEKIFYNLAKMAKPLASGIKWTVVKGTNMTIVYYEFTAGAVMPMVAHKHENAQFTLPIEGYIEQTVGTETKVVGPGDLVYIAPNVPHTGRFVGCNCKMIDVFTPNREDHLQNYLAGKIARMGDLPEPIELTPAPESPYPAFIHMEDGNIQLTKGCSLAPYDVPGMTAGFLNVGEDPQEDRHHHPYEQINTYLAGKMVMTVGSESEVVGPGWIVVIPPDVEHEGLMIEPALQVNFSSPARGPGYAEFLRNTFSAE